MLHLLADARIEQTPQPYAEALARLAGIRHALRLVDPFGGGPASDPADDERIADAIDQASESKRRCFDARSGRVVASTAAGLEALLAEHADKRDPNPAASRRIADEIRAGLEDVSKLMLGGKPVFHGVSGPDSLPLAL